MSHRDNRARLLREGFGRGGAIINKLNRGIRILLAAFIEDQ